MARQSSENSDIAMVALFISLCALVIPLGQVLGQYSATAEGYRKCQSSVMGPWARRTRLRWRWSQLRFETLFTVPRISLAAFHVEQDQQRVASSPVEDSVEYITGSPDSRNRTMSIPPSGDEGSSELASWLPFLESLHRNEWDLQENDCYQHKMPLGKSSEQHQLVGPAHCFQEMSWNSMPPDSIHPCAITTLSDIAIIARRLGMSWKIFDPIGGHVRAEGAGHAMVSTKAKSNSLVLHYIYISGAAHANSHQATPTVEPMPKTTLFIPTREADMMGFGLLPGCHRLQIPTLKMGTIDEVSETMDMLDNTRKLSRKLRDMRRFQIGLKWEHPCTFGFSDIIAMAAPILRIRGSTVMHVPKPAEYSSSLLIQPEGFVVFYNRLTEYLGDQTVPEEFQQVQWILKQYGGLKSRYGAWENQNSGHSSSDDLDFLEEVHNCWDTTTDYFVNLQDSNKLKYLDLVTSHISQAIKWWGDAWNNVKTGTARDKLGMRAVEVEGMHLYFDHLPLLVEDLRSRGFTGSEKLVYEAWFTLMFRAMCWWRCHALHPREGQTYKGSIIPSQFWNCKIPVYIE